MNAILERVDALGRFSYRRRWLVVVSWVLLIALSAALYLLGGGQSQTTADGFVGEAGAAEQQETGVDFLSSRTETVLVSADDAAAAERAATELSSGLDGAAHVDTVVDVTPSDSGTSQLVRVRLTDEALSPSVHVQGLADAMASVRDDNPGVALDATGPISVKADVTQSYAERLSLLEMLSLPVTAIVLFVVFAGVVAAAIPLVTGLCVVLLAIAWSGITSFVVPSHENQLSLILLMGLALGVDYSLFYVRRMREEFAEGGDADAAGRVAISATSRSVFVAALTTGVSVVATFLTESPIFHSLTLGLILVVIAAVLASATLLPALLGFGRKGVVRRRFGKQPTRSGDDGGAWGRLTSAVVRRPVAAAVAGGIVLVALAAPTAFMRLELPGTDSMPRTFESLRTLDAVADEFPLYGVSHTAVMDTGADPADAERTLDAIADEAATRDGFAEDRRPVEFSTDGSVARVEIPVVTREIESQEARDTLEVLRSEVIPAASGGHDVIVGGETAVSVDLSESVGRDLLIVVPIVLVLSLLMVWAAFRSIGLAAMSVALNLLSVLAAYGILTLVFQVGLGAPLLGSEFMGPVVTLLPIMMFVILFGLSTDYHVFILTRVQEAVAGGGRLDAAIRRGVVTSSVPVTAAAMVMVVVFAMFVVLPTPEMKQLGVGLAAAIALDATIVRGVMVPALLALLGDRVWRRSRSGEGSLDESAPRVPEPSVAGR